MKIENKYKRFLLGTTNTYINDLIAKRWQSGGFLDQARDEISKLKSPDREVYDFIVESMLGRWDKANEAVEKLLRDLSNFEKYHNVALRRMKAMVYLAKWQVSEAIEILEEAYRKIPYQYSWLRRTIAIDIRNSLMNINILLKDKGLERKRQKWQSKVLAYLDQNPLLDRNDSYSFKRLLKEYLETGTLKETTQRTSQLLAEALKLQYENYISSVRIGYYTGAFEAKNNIGLILYQWADVTKDPYLHMSSIAELIENGNKGEIEKSLEKHTDVLIGNRANAYYLFSKIESLTSTPLLEEVRLVVMRYVYDYLEDNYCEIIDRTVSEVLALNTTDNHILEMKRLAMRIVPTQSKRGTPDRFLEFAREKLSKRNEPWWFYLDLFRTLSSIDSSRCKKGIVYDLINDILGCYLSNTQLFQDLDIFNAIYNLANQFKIDLGTVDQVLISNYHSKEKAFEKHRLYFTALTHKGLSEIYEKYIQNVIESFRNDAQIKEEPKSFSISKHHYTGFVYNILVTNYEEVGNLKLWLELADAALEYCLCPYIVEPTKRRALYLIIHLSNKLREPDFWRQRKQAVKDNFENFARAIDVRLFVESRRTTIGALAGNAYLNMGGELSPPLWNYIWRDKDKSYEHRIDCINTMAEIAEKYAKYSTLAFFILSELISDKFYPVSCKALGRLASISELPENITPMICQSILRASRGGNERVRVAAAFCIMKIYGKIGSRYWEDTLEKRLEEMKADDSRLVRQQAQSREKN